MDLSTTANILTFLQNNGYLIIFLLALLEGPIITYVAAFAASLGTFNVGYVLLLSILGNVLGDIIHFFIGRLAKKAAHKYVYNLIDSNKIQKIKEFLNKHPGKTLAVIKLTPPLPTPGLILTGTTDIKFKTYLFYSIIISTIYSAVIVILGFYSGKAFNIISNYVGYIGYLIVMGILLVILVYIIFKMITKKISDKIEKI